MSSDLLANRKTIIISTEHTRPDIRQHRSWSLWCPSCINSVAGQLTLCKHRNWAFLSETAVNKWIFLHCKAYRGTDRTYFATGHVTSKLYCNIDFVSCSSKTTHDSNLLYWELQGRQSLMRHNAQLDRKFEYIMYDLGRLNRKFISQNFSSSLLIVISFQFHKSVTLQLSVS